jgi:hypothetical protein
LRIGLEHFGGLLEELLFHIGGRVLHRIAADVSESAGEGAQAKRGEVGIGAGNLNIFHGHAELFGGDCAHRGMHALSAFSLAA